MSQGKAFDIPKELVWNSYQEVRRNKGAPGCDGQTISQFDENRDRNLYKIWNRLSSGSYFPPPVREKRIPKEDGSARILGIPTVSDRIAQGAVKIYAEARLDPVFHQNSYGYRPGKSAHQALKQCAERCWSHNWVLEVDISKFFDNVRHDLVIKALEPVQNLLSKRVRKARLINCKLVLSFRSQFFHSLRHFSSHAKERSATQRFGITMK